MNQEPKAQEAPVMPEDMRVMPPAMPEAMRVMPTDEDYLAALGPCGK